MKSKNLYVLIGIPASGKTSFAKEQIKNTGGIHISRDNIRFALLQDQDDYFAFEPVVYKTWIEAIKAAIDDDALNTNDIYVDATTLSKQRRKELFYKLNLPKRKHHVNIHMKVFITDLNTCLARNSKRTGRALVPDATIRVMHQAFQMPQIDELSFVRYDSISLIGGKEDEN